MRVRTGFSLVELMIVVAIIGILAAIAMPNYLAMQLRAKRAELPANINGIRIAELSYDATYNTFVTASANPSSTPSNVARAWEDTPEWGSLGWAPDGLVRGSYTVEAVAEDFSVTAQSDLDADGVFALYTASSSTTATLDPSTVHVY